MEPGPEGQEDDWADYQPTSDEIAAMEPGPEGQEDGSPRPPIRRHRPAAMEPGPEGQEDHYFPFGKNASSFVPQWSLARKARKTRRPT